MAIELALYKDDKRSISEEIELAELALRGDFETVKKNLYCAFEGCTAKIEYVPSGKRREHFKTWPKNNHTPECDDYFERDPIKRKQKNIATNSVGLSDNHINNVLKGLIRSVEETPEEKEARLKKQRSRKKNKSNTVNTSQNSNDVENVRPTTDNNIEKVGDGQRSPSIRKRHSILFLSENDLNTAVALHEKVVSIWVEKNRAKFLLKNNAKETYLYFEEEFFANSSTNIEQMLRVVKNNLDKGHEIMFDGVGNVEKRDEELCVIITNQKHFRINKFLIPVYVSQSN
ncbi:hypothetical protein [Oceanobacillus sp. FSL K6-0127]|uniref:hypothetical protein n=1 Tax=Oceanobacillus sp. FSL K6-0127 TaxID=2921420 RepID=UPI0030ED6C28